uniref:HTH La-type RNA-binding domain-containing protein n=1 Tax=Syphacia muris TaxID=451379 RepID=A0A158R5A7_9BILA
MKVSAYNVSRVRGKLNDSDGDDQYEKQQPHETPPTPSLPWWFTVECEKRLSLTVDVPFNNGNNNGSSTSVTTASSTNTFTPAVQVMPPCNSQPVPSTVLYLHPEQVKEQLRKQLEYYFSRENLMTDRFLRSQMDNDSYVPIQIIADFPRVKQLTNDYDLIVQVLRESPRVQVDEKGERVRAVSKRCTIILRDIPQSTDKKDVAALFSGAPPYIRLQYGLNNSWYVIFESEEATQRAYLHLQNMKTFNDKPICVSLFQINKCLTDKHIDSPKTEARIKAGGAPCSEPMISFERPLSSLSVTFERPASVASTTHSEVRPNGDRTVHYTSELTPSPNEDFDLGKILTSHGYVPQAVYLAAFNEVRTFAVNTSSSFGRSGGQNRLRANGHPNYYRNKIASSKIQGVYRNRDGHQGHSNSDGTHYREHGTRREYSNTNFRNQHNNGRKVDNYSGTEIETNRDRNIEYQFRSRNSRPNSFIARNNASSTHNNRTSADNPRSSNGSNRNRISVNYEQKPKQTLNANQSNGRPRRSPAMSRTNRGLADDKDFSTEGYNSSSPCNDDSKSEASSKKTEEIEYNFEENAFPSLLQDFKEEVVKDEKPLFSKVAAGKKKERKDNKEKRSYAQMLKQGNG